MPSQEHVIIVPTMCQAAARYHNWTFFILCIECERSFSPRLCLIARMAFVFFVYACHTSPAWSAIFTSAPLQQHLVCLACFSSRCAVFGGPSTFLCVWWFCLHVCAYETPVQSLYGCAQERANKVRTTALHVRKFTASRFTLRNSAYHEQFNANRQEHNFLGLKVVALRM